MGWWLATAASQQAQDWLKRFDAAYWTVDFPRPTMASVVTTGPHGLRVEGVFYSADALAGLIWESGDRHDHPLLSYETARDYRGCVLSFRWRSGGLKPLDAVHGPTLTIEGRDANGVARSWYVRLWNHATGAPEDARVRLDFDALTAGWDGSEHVWAGDIDRMFISLAPAAYDQTATPLMAEGWAEMTEIACDGPASVLAVGDVCVPAHGLSIASGYDDSYHLTPARLLRQALRLGYRGAINHYVGMSHFSGWMARGKWSRGSTGRARRGIGPWRKRRGWRGSS